MHSPTLPSSAALSLSLFLLFIVLAIVFFWQESDKNQFVQAQELISEWNLAKAEQILEKLSHAHPTPEVLRLYAEVALKTGNVRKARFLLATLDSVHALAFHDSINVAFTEHLLGNEEKARHLAFALDTEVTRTGDSPAKSRLSNLLGLISFNEGRYEEALKHQSESLELARLSGSLQAEADAMRQLGVLAWYRGERDKAKTKYYEPALSLYQKIGDKIGEATTLSNIGLLYQDWNRWDENLKCQLRAFEIRKRVGDLRGLADSYYFLSTSGYLSKGKTFAYRYRMKSLELSTRIGYAWGREVAARSLEDLWREQPSFAGQMGAFRDSVFQLTGEGRLYVLWHAARKAKFERRWNESAHLYAEVARICDSLKYDMGRRVAQWEYGIMLRDAHRYTEAERQLLLCRAASRPDSIVAATDIELAEIYVLTGQPQNAIQKLKPLLFINDSSYLQALRGTNTPAHFDQHLGEVFKRRFRTFALLVAAMRQQGLGWRETFAFAERERHTPFWGEKRWSDDDPRQSNIEQFIRLLQSFDERPDEFVNIQQLTTQVVELQQAMAAEQNIAITVTSPSRRLEIATPAMVQRVLAMNEAFIEYFVGFNEVLVVVIRKDDIHGMALRAKPDELRTVAETFRQAILRGKDNPLDDLWKASASLLYEQLLQPLVDRKLISQGNHLIISPHLFLHHIPFQAFVDNRHQPALTNFVISYIPSATMLCKKRSKTPARPASIVALAPMESQLPFTEREIRVIQRLPFSESRIFVGSSATIASLFGGLEMPGVVHVASHAKMNNRFPFYSYIECADGNLELHEILRRPVSAQLVVLSSCETGETVGIVSDALTSENVVSFPRALLMQGASNVIASLWLVQDQVTSSLIARFYESMFSGETNGAPQNLSACLANAQRQLIMELQLSGKSHPFFWSPFLLVGDGR